MATDFAFVVEPTLCCQLTEEALIGLEECVAKERRPTSCLATVFWIRVFDADAGSALPQNAIEMPSAILLPEPVRQ